MEEGSGDRVGGILGRPVLLLNQSYEPLNVITVRRAIRLLLAHKAEVVYTVDGRLIKSPSLSMPVPSVLRMQYYIRVRRREPPLSKKNILRRDRYTCQYCGTRGRHMTVDHVIPRALGGGDTWENLVCACPRCNARKAERTPQEAGMRLLRKPKKPSYIGIILAQTGIPDSRWVEFVGRFL